MAPTETTRGAPKPSAMWVSRQMPQSLVRRRSSPDNGCDELSDVGDVTRPRAIRSGEPDPKGRRREPTAEGRGAGWKEDGDAEQPVNNVQRRIASAAPLSSGSMRMTTSRPPVLCSLLAGSGSAGRYPGSSTAVGPRLLRSLLAEERLEPGSRVLADGCRRGGSLAEREVVTEVPGLLVELTLRLVLCALVMVARVVEGAVAAAVEIAAAGKTGVTPADASHRIDPSATFVTNSPCRIGRAHPPLIA